MSDEPAWLRCVDCKDCIFFRLMDAYVCIPIDYGVCIKNLPESAPLVHKDDKACVSSISEEKLAKMYYQINGVTK